MSTNSTRQRRSGISMANSNSATTIPTTNKTPPGSRRRLRILLLRGRGNPPQGKGRTRRKGQKVHRRLTCGRSRRTLLAPLRTQYPGVGKTGHGHHIPADTRRHPRLQNPPRVLHRHPGRPPIPDESQNRNQQRVQLQSRKELRKNGDLVLRQDGLQVEINRRQNGTPLARKFKYA